MANIKRKRQQNTKRNKKNKDRDYLLTKCYIPFLIFITIFFIFDNLYIKSKIQDINAKVEKLNNNPTLEDISPHYVFLGDSIIKQYELSKYFKGYSVVNSGKDGDQTERLLNNMEERVYRYNPSTVFILIGTNDVKDNKSVEYIYENIKQIVEEIKINIPNTRIILSSILPSQENWGEHDNNEKRQKVNKLLKEEYDDTEVIYLDIYSALADKETNKLKDEYTNDGLHMNDKSYKIITEDLKKYMTLHNN